MSVSVCWRTSCVSSTPIAMTGQRSLVSADKSETKEQRKAERLARQRQMSAAQDRRRLIRRAGGAVLGVGAVGAVVVAAALGGGDARPSVGESKQLVAGSQVVFGQHYQTLDQRRKLARVPTMMDTMSSSVHFHPLISVWVDGKQMPVPANIGIDPTKGVMQMAGLHTHDASGTIHVEGVDHATLGQFFAIWGVPFPASQLGPNQSVGARQVRMWVKGKPSTAFGGLQLVDGQHIVVSFGNNLNAPA